MFLCTTIAWYNYYLYLQKFISFVNYKTRPIYAFPEFDNVIYAGTWKRGLPENKTSKNKNNNNRLNEK